MIKEKCLTCHIKSAAVGYLDETQLRILGENCAEALFRKGEVIFKQDSLSSNIIYLKDGLVKTSMEWNHKNQILNIIKAPAYLGIPTTLGDKINHYSVSSLEDSVVCFIDINTFKMLIDRNGKFAYEIIIHLCKNELKHYQRCVYRSQKHVSGLVADTLLFFSNEIYMDKTFKLPIDRGEFGDLIGTTRETVSRMLKEFHEDHLIEMKRKTVTLVNPDRLTKISMSG
jgi:CRP/FNR family transcriptional regulator